MKFHLNLEDVEGRVAMGAQWPEEFHQESHAHQIGLLLVKYVETLLVPLVEPEIVTKENAPDLSLVPPTREIEEPESPLIH